MAVRPGNPSRRLSRSESALAPRPSHHSGTQSSSSAPASGALGGNSPRARSHPTLAAAASNPTASACRRACGHPVAAVAMLLRKARQRSDAEAHVAQALAGWKGKPAVGCCAYSLRSSWFRTCFKLCASRGGMYLGIGLRGFYYVSADDLHNSIHPLTCFDIMILPYRDIFHASHTRGNIPLNNVPRERSKPMPIVGNCEIKKASQFSWMLHLRLSLPALANLGLPLPPASKHPITP